jgi:hypothetical protein
VRRSAVTTTARAARHSAPILVAARPLDALLALLALRVFLAPVRRDDALHERMPHDVLGVEMDERDARHAVENSADLLQARLLAARQVGLRDVARDDGTRAEAEARQEHLHLLRRRVLRLVEDHERLVERAAAHERERRDLDDVPLDEAPDLVESHHLVERVVHRPQIRIDLLREVARQEPEPLTGLDGRPHEHDSPHGVGRERLDGRGDREIGLSRTRGADAERRSDSRIAFVYAI